MAIRERLFPVRPLTNKEKGELVWAARYSCRSFCLALYRIGKVKAGSTVMMPETIIELLMGFLKGEKGVTSLNFPEAYNIRRTAMSIVMASQTGRRPGTKRWLEDLDFEGRDGSVETLDRVWLDDNPLPPPVLFGRVQQEPYQAELFEALELENDEELTA